MKIIHTGDIHIGAAHAGLPMEKAELRRAEILNGFRRLCAYAKRERVGAVVIAGDLFDGAGIARGVVAETMQAIAEASPVPFFYASGNHDLGLDFSELAPENLHCFSRAWESVALGENIVITGKNTDYAEEFFPPRLEENAFNIVALHGDIAREIPLARLRDRGIDYLALGHIHAPMLRAERLDGRGTYRYCGCLEGRGFDELGDRGFFLLEVKNGRITDEKFLSFATRKAVEASLDISGCVSYAEVERGARAAIARAGRENLVRLVLCGRHTPSLKKHLKLLAQSVSEEAFFVRIEDKSRILIDYGAFENDLSARGIFVKEVGRYEMNEELREEVLDVGLKALAGEEIDL